MEDPPSTCCASPLYAFSRFRLQWTFEASRWFQDGPRMPEEGPKNAPRRPPKAPRSNPRASQESPKETIFELMKGRIRSPSMADAIQDGPRGASETPKRKR